MLIIGAGGFAKELLQVVVDLDYSKEIVFFDDINNNVGDVFQKYRVINSRGKAVEYFEKVSPYFSVGVGKPKLRERFYNEFKDLGGRSQSLVSPYARVGGHVDVSDSATILANACISNSVVLGLGSLIYYNVIITHDCKIGDFVELSPGATILGNVCVGDYCHIGANATILSGLKIGKNSLIGAGAVVTKDVEENSIMVGVPARKVN